MNQMGKIIMNKLLLVEDINNISDGVYDVEITKDVNIDISNEVVLNNYDEENYSLKVLVEDKANLELNKVNIVNKDLTLEININNDAVVNFNWVIINKGKNKVNILINMIGNNSKCLAKVRIINTNKESNADVIFRGVIALNTKDNIMVEDLKGLILGDDTIKISPIMEVSTNEVMANHLVTIGSFNPEELFYLSSKGLSEKLAKDMLKTSFVWSILPDGLRNKIKMEVINYE